MLVRMSVIGCVDALSVVKEATAHAGVVGYLRDGCAGFKGATKGWLGAYHWDLETAWEQAPSRRCPAAA
jgi:hypothetical protein